MITIKCEIRKQTKHCLLRGLKSGDATKSYTLILEGSKRDAVVKYVNVCLLNLKQCVLF